MISPKQRFSIDNLKVEVFPDRKTMGKSAAEHVADQIKKIAQEKEKVRIIFASAVSQQEFLAELLEIKDIPWEKITAFHMDEYHTLPVDAPQRFGNFLKEHLFQHKNFGAVHYIETSLGEYDRLINEAPIDIACLGIGENGHLAFNDPPIANFDDPETIKEVDLDEICRQQQVNDGAFQHIDEVPKKAITLTIPTLLNSEFLSVVVPGTSKAKAVENTLFHPVATEWPSTILREHSNTKLFLDTHSAKNILEKT